MEPEEMGSQQRVLDITMRLLQGEHLDKQRLMRDYGKQEATIRRDIGVIEHGLWYRGLTMNRTHGGRYWLESRYRRWWQS